MPSEWGAHVLQSHVPGIKSQLCHLEVGGTVGKSLNPSEAWDPHLLHECAYDGPLVIAYFRSELT